MSARKSFFQEFFKSNASETVEEYRNLKENMSNVRILNSSPKAAYQYAEVRIKSRHH